MSLFEPGLGQIYNGQARKGIFVSYSNPLVDSAKKMSNEPTLLSGDHILTDRRASARNPEIGALMIFEFPEDPLAAEKFVGFGSFKSFLNHFDG